MTVTARLKWMALLQEHLSPASGGRGVPWGGCRGGWPLTSDRTHGSAELMGHGMRAVSSSTKSTTQHNLRGWHNDQGGGLSKYQISASHETPHTVPLKAEEQGPRAILGVLLAYVNWWLRSAQPGAGPTRLDERPKLMCKVEIAYHLPALAAVTVLRTVCQLNRSAMQECLIVANVWVMIYASWKFDVLTLASSSSAICKYTRRHTLFCCPCPSFTQLTDFDNGFWNGRPWISNITLRVEADSWKGERLNGDRLAMIGHKKLCISISSPEPIVQFL